MTVVNQNDYYATNIIDKYAIKHGDYININDVYVSPESGWTWTYSFPSTIYNGNVGINEQIIDNL